MLHAIIMAGGAGTRFWPASRKECPKQLLSFTGGRTMIRQTIDRLSRAVPSDRTLVITSESLVSAMKNELASLPAEAIVGEPCRRDTAPCIGLAAMLVLRNDPEATMVVLPADHVITPDDVFCDAILQGAALVEASPCRLVTYGIKPTYPAESFGYIECGEAVDATQNAPAYRVMQFREKPDTETAAGYLDLGTFYWNSGIFVWKAKTILDALAKQTPQMLVHLEKIVAAWGTGKQNEILKKEFAAIEGISIDYAVMEHATDVVVIEAPFQWDDVGSWQAIGRLVQADDKGNSVVGRHLGLETNRTIVHTSKEHLVVTIGMEDCIVVHTENATLVANKKDEEKVRAIVKELELRSWNEYL